MSIDYRNEVDNGFDRKRIVEKNIVYLLKKGIPLDIIRSSSYFIFPHEELRRNLERGYFAKVDEIKEIYDYYGISQEEVVVGDSYSGVHHPVGGELYPMTESEEKEKFKLRDEYLEKIEKLKNDTIKKLRKDKEKTLNLLTKYKIKYPMIDNILAYVEELDNLITSKEGKVDNKDIEALYKKHSLNPKMNIRYNTIYEEYKKILDDLSKTTMAYEDACNGKVNNSEIITIIGEEKELETELIKRNTKLVNGFIRQRYSDLLVETEELFQTCYLALWEAIKEFDYKKGYRFSTFAYVYMDRAVAHNFKELTGGYSWRNYWNKKKVKLLLENTGRMLGREVTVSDLAKYGMLDMSETSALNYLHMADVYPMSFIFPKNDTSYDEYLVDANYQMTYGDDEVDDYEEIDEKLLTDEELAMYEKEVQGIYNDLLSDAINDAIDSLTPREAKVLRLRFGLADGRCHTLEEVGKEFGVTRDRIRQIEAKALRKLRHPSRSKGMQSYL